MAIRHKFKRRPAGGAAGAPASLLSGEPAYNEQDKKLYLGVGDDGLGNATSIAIVAGEGAYIDLATDQLIGGTKTFSASPVVPDPTAANHAASRAYVDAQAAAAGVADNSVTNAKLADMAESTFKGRANGVGAGDPQDLTAAQVRGALNVQNGANNYVHPSGDGNRHVPATGTTNNGRFLKAGSTAASETWEFVTKSDVGLNNVDNTSDAAKPISTAQQAALDGKAPLNSPALTGTPIAPTAPGGTNTTQIATTGFVAAAIGALIDGAPGAIDTLNELAAALGDDPNFASTVTNSLAEKLAKAQNLADLPDVATARTNLGLGNMATQNANGVAISGGSITGVVLDGGTF